MTMNLPTRNGCCADWPKPCPYHEGVQDTLVAISDHSALIDALDVLLKQVERFMPGNSELTDAVVKVAYESGAWRT